MVSVNVKANVRTAVPVNLPSEASFQSYILQMQALLSNAEETIEQLVAQSQQDINDAVDESKLTLQGYINQGNEILQDTINNKNPLAAYPVGSYYFSANAESPADLFGGTWEQLEQGRVLLSQGTNYPAGSTGGEATHTLTVAEMPSHNHTGTAVSSGAHTHNLALPRGDQWYSNGSGNGVWGSSNNSTWTTASAGAHTHSLTINNTGSGTAHNNMPPYLSVYVWKRTA